MRGHSILYVALLLLLLTSCSEYELLEHQKECKRLADSTYRKDLNRLVADTDSLCDLNYDTYYQASLDSLIPARMAEVKKLINK